MSNADLASVADAAATPSGAQRMTPQDALGLARRLMASGKLREAENVARQVAGKRPGMADAQNVLGAILHRLGLRKEAADVFRQAVALVPDEASYHANLGEVERQLGNFDAALEALRRAVALDPRSAQAHNNLGIVLFDRKAFDQAEEAYRAAVRLNPRFPEAHNNLGNALRAMQRPDAALEEYEAAVAARDNYAEAYSNMGVVLREKGHLQEAEFALRKAIGIRPTYAEAYQNLASLFLQRQAFDEALRLLGDGLRAGVSTPAIFVTIARAQLALGNLGQADQAVSRALAADPDSYDALCLLGQISLETDRFDRAVGTLERAVALRPDGLEALNLLGVVYKALGRLPEARATLRLALEIDPKAVGTYSNLVDLEDFGSDPALIETMRAIHDEAERKDEPWLIPLHFALGKAHEDTRDFDRAFFHYSSGAALKRASLHYDEAGTFGFFDDIREVFSRDFLAAQKVSDNATELPVFIVGMPRSGSTLVEQIVSAHPAVHGAGEIKALSIALNALRQKFPTLPKFPRMMERMKPGYLEMVAQGYLKQVPRDPAAVRVTDKLLTNYFFVGLIHLMFPRARVIHTIRNPIDSCLSSFTKLFKDDMPHSYDFGELGRYYRKYEELMVHWRAVLPAGVMLDVRYEDVVADPEARARELIAFLGLEWDDCCLAFHQSSRPVKTASVSQVRRPLYSTSVERWRRYGDRLTPLIEALGLSDPAAS